MASEADDLPDEHQDIHDALGIQPLDDQSGRAPPWKYPTAPTMLWDKLQQNFEQRFPKDFYRPPNWPIIKPRVLWPSKPDSGGAQQGGGAISELAPPSPLQQQIAKGPGAVLGGISNALGITDAAKALRGEMTEDEAKEFALGALPGLLPGGKPTEEMLGLARVAGKAFEKAGVGPLMKDLFPKSGVLGKIGQMTPSEYVKGFGDTVKFSQTFPESFKVIEPHLNEDQKTDMSLHYIQQALNVREPEAPAAAPNYPDDQFAKLSKQYNDWLKKEGLPKVSMDEHDMSQLTPTQQLKIGDFQNKWNAMMNDQLTGAGPSTGWTPNKEAQAAQIQKSYTTTNLLHPRDFPQNVPFGVPPQGQSLGFTQPAVHGTAGRWGWEGPLDQLRLPEDQIGVHFGNPKQAARFSVPASPKDYLENGLNFNHMQPRTFPVVLQMQNPLEMADMGSWHVDEMKQALRQINAGKHMSYAAGEQLMSPQHKGLFPDEELDKVNTIEGMRDYIASKGFDSIKYINSVEDRGKPSYILFHESPTQPGYVIGARSPFARFDPQKLHLPSLTAGGAGILAYPLLSRNGREEK